MVFKGLNYLRDKLNRKTGRVKTRYKFYEMKARAEDLHISTPPELTWWMTTLGWCEKAVDSLADRLVFREFSNDPLEMDSIYDQNNKDVLIDSAILSALITSCSFVYITADEYGNPRMRVIDGMHATGEIDTTTNLLSEGYAILECDEFDNPITEAYLLPGVTYIYEHGKMTRAIKNDAPYPLLVPIINRPDAKRPFGHSRITRACMDLQCSAVRTVKRSEISAEFYSFPQKYVLGMDPDAEEIDKWLASMSSLLRIDKDENGDKPQVGQFTQQSMAPHTEQLRMFAGMFAGETGLTLDDMGFPSQNPSSADAIKSSHETLRLTARKAQRDFSVGLKNVGYLAACVRDRMTYSRRELAQVGTKWQPIFEPDASQLSVIGDGVIKINQAVPGYFDANSLRDLTGIEGAEQEPEFVSVNNIEVE